MAGLRKKRRTTKQALLRRAVIKAGRIANDTVDRSALYDVPQTRSSPQAKAITVLPSFNKDAQTVHIMQRSLSNNSGSSWEPRGTQRISRINPNRTEAKLQNIFLETPFRSAEQRKGAGNVAAKKLIPKKPNTNDNRSGVSLKALEPSRGSKGSRASSLGYPSSWNLDVPGEDEVTAVVTNDLSISDIVNCEALNRTVYDHRLNAPVTLRRPKMDNAVQCVLPQTTKTTTLRRKKTAGVQTQTTTKRRLLTPRPIQYKLPRLQRIRSRMFPIGTRRSISPTGIIRMDRLLGITPRGMRPRVYSGKTDLQSESVFSNVGKNPRSKQRASSGSSSVGKDGEQGPRKFEIAKDHNYGGYTPSDCSCETKSIESLGNRNKLMAAPKESSEHYSRIEEISQPPTVQERRKQKTESSLGACKCDGQTGNQFKTHQATCIKVKCPNRNRDSRMANEQRMKEAGSKAYTSGNSGNTHYCYCNQKKSSAAPKNVVFEGHESTGDNNGTERTQNSSSDRRVANSQSDTKPTTVSSCTCQCPKCSNAVTQTARSDRTTRQNRQNEIKKGAHVENGSDECTCSCAGCTREGTGNSMLGNGAMQNSKRTTTGCNCKCPACTKAKSKGRQSPNGASQSSRESKASNPESSAKQSSRESRVQKPVRASMQSSRESKHSGSERRSTQSSRGTRAQSPVQAENPRGTVVRSKGSQETNGQVECHCLKANGLQSLNGFNEFCIYHCPGCLNGQQPPIIGAAMDPRGMMYGMCPCQCPACRIARNPGSPRSSSPSPRSGRGSPTRSPMSDSDGRQRTTGQPRAASRRHTDESRASRQNYNVKNTSTTDIGQRKASPNRSQSSDNSSNESNYICECESPKNSINRIPPTSSTSSIQDRINKEVQCECTCPNCGININNFSRDERNMNTAYERSVDENSEQSETEQNTNEPCGETQPRPDDAARQGANLYGRNNYGENNNGSEEDDENCEQECKICDIIMANKKYRMASETQYDMDSKSKYSKNQYDIESDNKYDMEAKTKNRKPHCNLATCTKQCNKCKITPAKTKRGDALVNLVVDNKCNVNQIIQILQETVTQLEGHKKLLSQSVENAVVTKNDNINNVQKNYANGTLTSLNPKFMPESYSMPNGSQKKQFSCAKKCPGYIPDSQDQEQLYKQSAYNTYPEYNAFQQRLSQIEGSPQATRKKGANVLYHDQASFDECNCCPPDQNRDAFMARSRSGSTYPSKDVSNKSPVLSSEQRTREIFQKLKPTKSFIDVFHMALALKGNTSLFHNPQAHSSFYGQMSKEQKFLDYASNILGKQVGRDTSTRDPRFYLNNSPSREYINQNVPEQTCPKYPTSKMPKQNLKFSSHTGIGDRSKSPPRLQGQSEQEQRQRRQERDESHFFRKDNNESIRKSQVPEQHNREDLARIQTMVYSGIHDKSKNPYFRREQAQRDLFRKHFKQGHHDSDSESIELREKSQCQAQVSKIIKDNPFLQKKVSSCIEPPCEYRKRQLQDIYSCGLEFCRKRPKTSKALIHRKRCSDKEFKYCSEFCCTEKPNRRDLQKIQPAVYGHSKSQTSFAFGGSRHRRKMGSQHKRKISYQKLEAFSSKQIESKGSQSSVVNAFRKKLKDIKESALQNENSNLSSNGDKALEKYTPIYKVDLFGNSLDQSKSIIPANLRAKKSKSKSNQSISQKANGEKKVKEGPDLTDENKSEIKGSLYSGRRKTGEKRDSERSDHSETKKFEARNSLFSTRRRAGEKAESDFSDHLATKRSKSRTSLLPIRKRAGEKTNSNESIRSASKNQSRTSPLLARRRAGEKGESEGSDHFERNQSLISIGKRRISEKRAKEISYSEESKNSNSISFGVYSYLNKTKRARKLPVEIPEITLANDAELDSTHRTKLQGLLALGNRTKKDRKPVPIPPEKPVKKTVSVSSGFSSFNHRKSRRNSYKEQSDCDDVKVLYDSSYKFSKHSYGDGDSNDDCETDLKKHVLFKSQPSSSQNNFFCMLKARDKYMGCHEYSN